MLGTSGTCVACVEDRNRPFPPLTALHREARPWRCDTLTGPGTGTANIQRPYSGFVVHHSAEAPQQAKPMVRFCRSALAPGSRNPASAPRQNGPVQELKADPDIGAC
jgi:hypothetical protein